MSINWVMLQENAGFVKLANERILLQNKSRISCEVSIPPQFKERFPNIQYKSKKGVLFLTSQRIIYLPSAPTPEFQSFCAPILKFEDSTTESSMWSGWVWKSGCTPVSGGGFPAELPRLDVKFAFSDGGMMEFNEAYIRLRERLYQYREMRRETGADVPDEPLPAYEASGITSSSPAMPRNTRSDSGLNRRTPDEPPPDYEEAQAQQLSIRLEDHVRDEVNRGTVES